MTDREIFAKAIQIPDAGQRERFLDEACTGDAALRARVRAMIDVTGAPVSVARSPAVDATVTLDAHAPRDGGLAVPGHVADPFIGATVGGVTLERVIGQGGMGKVYVGTQTSTGGVVAVKVLLPHVVSDAMLRRFDLEARLLARLRHPGIAQIHSAGTCSVGGTTFPYFVMEHIADALPITTYADSNGLGTAARLELFSKACQGVAHGHEHGVIHRDLKPANILVDRFGQPKVIDFGVAKCTDADTTMTTLTAEGGIVGTLRYMSPEQAAGEQEAITVRSDVHALGVILYELLAGQMPFDFRNALPIGVAQIIRTQDPRPLSSVSRTFRGDLDAITAKCLEKDRRDRYASASELASDIGRYLAGEPITAVAPGFWDGVVRLARRHKAAAAAVAGVAASLVAAVVGISVFAYRAERAKDAAETSRVAETEQRNLAERQRVQAEENATVAREQAQLALDGMKLVLTEVDARLGNIPGTSTARLAILDAMSKQWERLDTNMAGGARGDSMTTLMAMRFQAANVYSALGRTADSDREYAKLYAMSDERIATQGRNDTTRMNKARICLAWAATKEREEKVKLLTEAGNLASECYSHPKPTDESPSLDSIIGMIVAATQNLAVVRIAEGNMRDAADTTEGVLEILSKLRSHNRTRRESSPVTGEPEDDLPGDLQDLERKSRLTLAYVYLRLGRTAEALDNYERVITDYRNALDGETSAEKRLQRNADLAGALGNYGQALVWLEEPDRALPMISESLQAWEMVEAADPEKVFNAQQVATALYRLAVLRDLQGDEVGVVESLDRSRDIRQRLAHATPNAINRSRLMLALARRGQTAEARLLADELGAVKQDALIHVERARALAQISRHLPESERPGVVADSLTALEKAVAEGYSDPFLVKAEPDLAPLRSETRFDAVVARLEAGINRDD